MLLVYTYVPYSMPNLGAKHYVHNMCTSMTTYHSHNCGNLS